MVIAPIVASWVGLSASHGHIRLRAPGLSSRRLQTGLPRYHSTIVVRVYLVRMHGASSRRRSSPTRVTHHEQGGGAPRRRRPRFVQGLHPTTQPLDQMPSWGRSSDRLSSTTDRIFGMVVFLRCCGQGKEAQCNWLFNPMQALIGFPCSNSM